jgi:hypothetical protein
VVYEALPDESSRTHLSGYEEITGTVATMREDGRFLRVCRSWACQRYRDARR